jgi:hypothetical protein
VKLLLLAAALLNAQSEGLRNPLTGEHAAFARFARATNLQAFVQQLDEPLWQEALSRLKAANPGRDVAVEAIVAEELARYEQSIEAIAPIMAGMALPRGKDERSRVRDIERAEKMLGHTTAKALLAVPAEATACFAGELDAAECEAPLRLAEQVRASGNADLTAFFETLTALRGGTAAALAMSVADGNPLRLINRGKVEGAGLTWPERGGVQ